MIRIGHFAFMAMILASSGGSSQEVKLGTLKVVLEGFKNQNGQVKVGLEKSAQDFDKGPLHEAHYRGEIAAIKGSEVTLTFRDVPYGTYAVKAFHDADSNGELNSNFVGIPTEDYGFSNNVRGTMGPASFQDARFEFNAEEKTLRIHLK